MLEFWTLGMGGDGPNVGSKMASSSRSGLCHHPGGLWAGSCRGGDVVGSDMSGSRPRRSALIGLWNDEEHKHDAPGSVSVALRRAGHDQI